MKRAAWILVTTLATACTPTSAPPAAAAGDVANAGPVAPPTAEVPSSPSPSSTATGTVASASAPAPSASTTSLSADEARDQRIRDKFGRICKLERTCGTLWGVDCNAAGDGPYYYVKADTLEKVAGCGGLCRGGRCTSCPPKEWACATY